MDNDRKPRLKSWIQIMDQDFQKPRQEVINANKEAAKDRIKQIREKERAERRDELWLEYELASLLCLHCYGLGHRRPCSEPGILACSRCFTLNRFTVSCNCRNKHEQFVKPPGQLYRMAGDPAKPLFYMDIMIVFRRFEAQVSNGQTTSTINHHLAKWLEELTELVDDEVEHDDQHMVVPINHRGDTIRILCKVVRYQEQEIILGTDYQMKKGFSSTMDRITLTQDSIVLSHPREIQYVYNLPQGEPLRRFIRTHGGALRSSRIYELQNWPPADQQQAAVGEADEQPPEDVIHIDSDVNLEELSNM